MPGAHGAHFKKDFPNSPRANGRPKGTGNKTTMIIKEATLLAANAVGAPTPVKNSKGEIVGYKKTGRGGLQGYLEHIALAEPKSFVALLSRIMPVQINHATVERPLEETDYNELLDRLRHRGVPIDAMFEDISDADVIDAEVIASDDDEPKLLT